MSYGKTLTQDEVIAVLLHSDETLDKDISKSTCAMIRTMARSYKTDPIGFTEKYKAIGNGLKNLIKDFVDNNQDYINETGVHAPGETRAKRLRTKHQPKALEAIITPDIKMDNLQQTKLQVAEVLKLLGDTIKVLQTLADKL